MKAILADYNLEGHLQVLLTILEGDEWRDIWAGLSVAVYTFEHLGLPGTTPDDELWRLCQREQIVLLTANRNYDGPNSLEAVIRTENRPDSLPVFTIADARRVYLSRDYAARVVERLLDYLLRIEALRGTGRLFLP